MEDLGEAFENFVETFTCKEELSSCLPGRTVPSTHANLLVASSTYGYLFAAVGPCIAVYSHASLRDGHAIPVAVVDLEEEQVTSTHALALGAHDTLIAHVTTTSDRSVVILNIPALVASKIHALPGPSGDVDAFSVSETQAEGTSQVLATLEGAVVQLHVLTADGTTPTTRIAVSNARCTALSPKGDLLAIGTERGSVVLYSTKTGEIRATIVEVESGWVPFSTHFADNFSILVSYNCETEVRHVVWHLSADGSAVTGHSPLGELCLAFLPFDDGEPKEAPTHPMITCISLHEWNMCVIGSSMSSDVEIIRKTDSEWEVWKFDEGKSPTLPTDENDDDTYCVGLAFDLNNTALIPGPDASSPKINPMPRVIVYTSDSMLLPFALIDSNPGVKCDAVGSAKELPPIPVNLRSIRSASVPGTEAEEAAPATPVNELDTDTVSSKARFRPGEMDYRPPMPTYSEHKLPGSSLVKPESGRESLKRSYVEDSDHHELSSTDFGSMKPRQDTFASANSENGLRSSFREQQSFEGVTSFLDNFSFKETSREHGKPPTEISSAASLAMKPDRGQFEKPESTAVQPKPKVSLAPSLIVAEAEANSGDIYGLLKSIVTEMSEELRVSAEAEQMVSQEIAVQKDTIVSSIAETREQLLELLQLLRTLFRNEATLQNNVSSTLSKVLSLSREYEKMSLEFHVKEADGFSRSLRSEEKEFDDKIAAKEAEVLRSISSIEERLNAETEVQARRKSSADLVQQVYSSLSLQGIRIKRVRSFLAALSERMDSQDKGGRLSHLGLSLARLEKLNIHDEDLPDHSQTPDKNRRRESVGMDGTPNSVNNVNKVTSSHSTSNPGDDTQLLPSDVRAVMRRLSMSGGRANISVTVPQSRTKRGRVITTKEKVAVSDTLGDRTVAANGSKERNSSGVAFPSISASRTVSSTRAGSLVKPEGISTLETMFPSFRESETADSDRSRKLFNSRILEIQEQSTHVDSAVSSSETPEVRNADTWLKTPALPFVSQTVKSQQSIDRADGVPYASLPPKKPLGQMLLPPSAQRSSPASYVLGSTSFGDKKQREYSEVSPERSTFPSAKRQGNGKMIEANKTKKLSIAASAPQFAGLPPDDDEGKQKPSIAASAPQFASLPPDDDERKQKALIPASASTLIKKGETPKDVSLSGLFAVLPPDSDAGPIPTSSGGDVIEKPRPTQAKESEDTLTASRFFATPPPGTERSNADKQRKGDGGEKEEDVSLFDGTRLESIALPSLPSMKKESLGTSDLFAALPPDDSGIEEVRPTVTDATATNLQSDRPPTSNSADAIGNVSVSASKTSPFASPFGTPQQSAPAFGSASLFGANATGTQSAPSMSAPERQESRDGTSSESEEQSTRFGGGMDTSSGGVGLFGASSSDQGNKQGFGFGSKPDDGSGAPKVFEPSGASPFGSLSQSQPFGQPTLSKPPTQTGFGSLAGPQGSLPSAFQTSQPVFGATTAFGAANAPPAFGMESTFGAASPPGASSSFGVPSQLGMGSTPFASTSAFGGGMSAPKFGESSFGMTSSFGTFSQDLAGSGFGNTSAAPSASPFGSLPSGGGFGGASGGGTGFAALAGGQSGALVFGNGGGPPSFTSAAFSQRRA